LQNLAICALYSKIISCTGQVLPMPVHVSHMSTRNAWTWSVHAHVAAIRSYRLSQVRRAAVVYLRHSVLQKCYYTLKAARQPLPLSIALSDLLSRLTNLIYLVYSW